MYFNFRILLHSAIYVATLAIVLVYPEYSLTFLAGVCSVLFLNVSLMRKTLFFRRFSALLLPMLLSFFSLAMLLFVDDAIRAKMFAFMNAPLFYLSLLGERRLLKDPTDVAAQGFASASLVGTLLIFFSVLVGFYLNFDVESWMLVPLYFAVVFGLSYQFFLVTKRIERQSARRSALILAFFSAEMFWISSFWPFGYLTTGIITLIFYYVLWDMLHAYMIGLLTKHRVIADMAILLVLTGTILATTRWTVIY